MRLLYLIIAIFLLRWMAQSNRLAPVAHWILGDTIQTGPCIHAHTHNKSRIADNGMGRPYEIITHFCDQCHENIEADVRFL